MIKFRMVRISTEQFAILANEAPAMNAKINLETLLGFKEARAEKQIACDVIFKFATENNPFLMLNVMCAFEVSKDNWSQMTQSDGSIILPKDFLCHIAVHTVGTARGILHEKTDGTPFNRFILPPINVDQMIEDDIVIDADHNSTLQ